MRTLALFVVLLAAIGCQPAVQVAGPPKIAAAPPLGQPPPPRARATRCLAEPSTVYGEEEVVFRVEGESPSNASVDTELRDERQQAISRGTMTLPGELRPPGVPSGDFVLIVGSRQGQAWAPSLVSCAVTVNRELSRATPMVR